MNLQPLTDHLIVKPLKQEKTETGIVLPEEAQEKGKGEVLAVGPGRTLDNGSKLEMSIKVGDKVIYREYAGDKMKISDGEVILLTESDILAIIN
jgi:chaperonin GroES